MKTLCIAFALLVAVFADPIPQANWEVSPSDDAGKDADVEDTDDLDLIVDLKKMASNIVDLQQNVDKLLEALEETAQNISALAPHVIRKRQTTVDGSIERGPGGSTGRIDVNHRRGGTTYNGHVSRGPYGTSYGGGVNHETRNGHFGGSFERDNWGTLGRVQGGRTWNNGNTRLGGYYERHSRGGSSGGIRFSHRF